MRLKGRADVTVSLNPKYQMLICTITIIIRVNINSTSHLCHSGTRAGPRGSVTWPCVPRLIHVGPRDKCTLFALFLINLNAFKIKINSYKFQKNSYKL